MMNIDNLQDISRKQQTEFGNVVREYVQHLFLSYFYQLPDSNRFLFKGGTALRIIYESPRFSEDLDFTGQNIFSNRVIDDIFIKTIRQLEQLGLNINLDEAKPTSGGYLGVITFKLHGISDIIKFEVSLRPGKKKLEVDTISGMFLPAYSLMHLNGKTIVQEKVQAMLTRGKPRDFYDFYFMSKHHELHKYLEKDDFPEIEKAISESQIDFKRELSVLLPRSHHMIIRDFKDNLLRVIRNI
ncbi:MAG: nucleotidyl transferase AbiEii/AbiGii toxin family protein [Patescibacteria group bacterium]